MAEIKRPLSAFMIYSVSIRPSVKTEHPEFSFGQLGREIGAQWRAMTEEQKAPFIAKAKEALAQYNTLTEGMEKPKRKPSKKAKAKAAAAAEGEVKIKRPLSSFMCFSKANRADIKAKNPTLTFGELGSKIGAIWKELPAEQKAPFIEQAKTDLARYKAEKK